MPPLRSKKSANGSAKSKKNARAIPQESEESASDNESVNMMDKDSDEEELDRLVLGDGAGFTAQLGQDMDFESEDNEEGEKGQDEEREDIGIEGVDDADLFFLDSGPSTVPQDALIPHPQSEDEEGGDALAWEDSDDDRLNVSLAGNSRLRKLRVNEGEDIVSGKEYTRRLRMQFERLNPVPEWAQSSRPTKRRRRSSAASDSSLSSNDMDVDDSDLSTLPLARLLQDAGALTKEAPATSKRPKLRPEVLDIQRTRDIPKTQPSAVTSLSFHPEYPCSRSENPIATSAFLHPSGDKIIFAGRRRYFHIWDLPSGEINKVTRIYGHKDDQKTMERFKLSPCGRYMGLIGSSKKGGGLINILDATTTQWIASARIEGKNGVADFAWWRNGEGLTVVGKGGEVGEWSMETGSFVARWNDDGSIGATVLTLGGPNGPKQLGGDRWVVIGSQSGVVNIYDRKNFISGNDIKIPERPEPNRRLLQLTTPTSHLQISPDGQLLVFSSRWKKDALRLVHLPSCTVYKNWPTSNTPLGRISSVAFGSGSDVLAVGNEAGKIKLWEIRS
ncbi:U3 small nucleolar RNA-associated protein [Botrytis cinerea]